MVEKNLSFSMKFIQIKKIIQSITKITKKKNLPKKTIYRLNKPKNISIVRDFVQNNFHNLLFSLYFVLDFKKADKIPHVLKKRIVKIFKTIVEILNSIKVYKVHV